MKNDTSCLIDSLFEESCEKFNLEFEDDYIKSIAKILFAVSIFQAILKRFSEACSKLEDNK